MESQMLAFVFILCFSLSGFVEGNGACFQFSGPGRFIFQDNIVFSTKSHFKLSFKTIRESGVIFYAGGLFNREQVYDYEGLFLHDGYLHYFLFNPGRYSIGSSFGFHGRSNVTLNDGYWHTVDFFRNKEVEVVNEDGSKKHLKQTGLSVNGTIMAVDNRWRNGVNIGQPIYLGQDPYADDRRGPSLGGFLGRIKDFQEVNHDHYFMQEFSREGDVSHCLAGHLGSV